MLSTRCVGRRTAANAGRSRSNNADLHVAFIFLLAPCFFFLSIRIISPQGVDAGLKHFGKGQSASTTEKISDGIRTGFKKMTGKGEFQLALLPARSLRRSFANRRCPPYFFSSFRKLRRPDQGQAVNSRCTTAMQDIEVVIRK